MGPARPHTVGMARGPDPARVCEDLLEAHFHAQPEDASCLGSHAHDGRLGDPSPAAAEAERAALEAIVRDIAAAEPRARDDDARLDLDAAGRIARFDLRYLETDGHASNLELALLPNAALRHAAIHGHGSSDRAARERAVPGFLARHAENLRRGVRERRAPDRDVAIAFAEHLLPEVARTTTGDVSAAYASFARFVADEVVPAARPIVRLGEAEVLFRLRDVMGVMSTPAELLALAREELARARERIGGADVGALLGAQDARIEDVVRRYERHLLAATRFVRERDIVAIPEDLALAFEPLPPAVADGSPVTNWPAPLLDARARGHVLYGGDAAAHATVATKNLAVHEGIPGHYLQCAVWQRAFASGEAPRHELVRYLALHDDVAMSRGCMASALAVEGWAVHMERTLLREGFYDTDDERLFFAVCDAIRAARVVLDLELHAGDLDVAGAVRLVAEATGMPERWARGQVLRAKRMPLQGLSYLVGAAAIEALRRELDAPSAAFHRGLLALGPVPPSRARGTLRA
jgi:uncharacterized protein (DUF885 family)